MAAEIEAIARAWMAHQGYTDDQVNAIDNNHRAYGCEFEPNSQQFDCTNENGDSRHPAWDDLHVACEIAGVAVEALESIGWVAPEIAGTSWLPL